MRWLSGTAEPGDWVRTTRTIRVTFTDHLLGGDAGIKPGTRGVVVHSLGWNAVEVRFDTGLWGSVTARANQSQLRVTRRRGGVAEHAARSSTLRWLRAGVAAAMVAPFALFSMRFLIAGGSKDGLLVALLDAALQGTLDTIGYALSEPFNALLYLAVLWAAGRFAFRA